MKYYCNEYKLIDVTTHFSKRLENVKMLFKFNRQIIELYYMENIDSWRHVLPILGVPDALVPLNLPVSQINLSPGYERN